MLIYVNIALKSYTFNLKSMKLISFIEKCKQSYKETSDRSRKITTTTGQQDWKKIEYSNESYYYLTTWNDHPSLLSLSPSQSLHFVEAICRLFYFLAGICLLRFLSWQWTFFILNLYFEVGSHCCRAKMNKVKLLPVWTE